MKFTLLPSPSPGHLFYELGFFRSEVAGRMSVQEGAKFLERPMEGRGKLLSGTR